MSGGERACRYVAISVTLEGRERERERAGSIAMNLDYHHAIDPSRGLIRCRLDRADCGRALGQIALCLSHHHVFPRSAERRQTISHLPSHLPILPSPSFIRPSVPRLLSSRIRINTKMFQGNRVHIITVHTLEVLNLDFQPNPLSSKF